MVGYSQDMLKQKAKQYGFQGEMADFPKYLEQNQDVARQYFAQQNSDMYQQGQEGQKKVDGVTTVPRTYEGESLAYISDEEALLLREKGGGVPPNDPSGQITKFGIPSFDGGGGAGAGGGGGPNWMTSGAYNQPGHPMYHLSPNYRPPAPAPAPPQNVEPLPLVVGDAKEDAAITYELTAGGPRWLFNNLLYTNQADAQAAFDTFQQQQAAQPPAVASPAAPQPQNLVPLPLIVGDASMVEATKAFNKSANPTIPSTTGGYGAQTLNNPSLREISGQRVSTPALPYGTQFQAALTPFEQAQNIGATTGQVTADLTIDQAAQVPIGQTAVPTPTEAAEVAAAAASPAVQQAAIQAAQIGAPTQTVEAAQQAQTQVANLQAAQQAQAAQIQAPADRALQATEQISGPAQQAVEAAAFVEPALVASQANPSTAATVQGQLAILSEQFVQGEVPFWAAGAVRAATQKLEARGLGASSMTAQAIVQASLEAALPIAQADARTIASFEAQNLTNRQQTAMLTGQYRAQFLNQEFDQAFQTRVRNAATVSDIANRNFTAEQQIALENSKLTQTVDLTNLSNQQALVMANAGALASLDISNLNNRQQAAVQNAQSFLQLDVGNLNNNQQAAVVNGQQQVQSLLTDAAAENAARQFNATSQQQTDQFFANLIAGIGQQNTAQANAMNQFNTGEVNALQRFNSELSNQRDQFNARNQLAIGQSNAVWRREIATADTAATNFQNQFNAQNLLELSNEAYDNLWQEYRDMLEFAWTSGESELDRIASIQLAQVNAANTRELAEFQADRERSSQVGGFIAQVAQPFIQVGASALAEWAFS